jgi:hypothetical protein
LRGSGKRLKDCTLNAKADSREKAGKSSVGYLLVDLNKAVNSGFAFRLLDKLSGF